MIDPETPVAAKPSAVRVKVIFGGAFSAPENAETLFWPEGWRLPQVGESISVRKGLGGFVSYVEWDLIEGVVMVKLR